MVPNTKRREQEARKESRYWFNRNKDWDSDTKRTPIRKPLSSPPRYHDMFPSISRSVSSSYCLVLASSSSRPSPCCLLLRKASFLWKGRKELIATRDDISLLCSPQSKSALYIVRYMWTAMIRAARKMDGYKRQAGEHGDNTRRLIVRSCPFILMIQRFRRAPVR